MDIWDIYSAIQLNDIIQHENCACDFDMPPMPCTRHPGLFQKIASMLYCALFIEELYILWELYHLLVYNGTDYLCRRYVEIIHNCFLFHYPPVNHTHCVTTYLCLVDVMFCIPLFGLTRWVTYAQLAQV